MNKFVVANAKLCIGCQTCEIACVVAHNHSGKSVDSKHFHPRLKVVKEAHVTMPVLCHQCENAPCVNACPTGALMYTKDLVQVDQSKCDGCRSCVLACPFGVMTVAIDASSDFADAPQTGAEAQKCDLCIDRKEGPACIEVCPTKALFLMEPMKLQKLRQERQALTLSARL
ncbi:MAG: 4Fe-4S dicluster domain-containing protein [Saezia sp.]